MLPEGVHEVSKRLADGSRRYYYYAWRCGPLIYKGGRLRSLPLEFRAALEAAHAGRRNRRSETVTQYLRDYRLQALPIKAMKTRQAYLRAHDDIEAEFGDVPLSDFDDPSMRRAVLEWRERWRETPRAADMRLQALSAFLSWCETQGALSRNHISGLPKLYRSDRSLIVWTPEKCAALLAHASPELAYAFELARLSGLRLGDLVAAPWTADFGTRLKLITSKRKKPVIIPCFDELRALLDRIPRRAVQIITNSSGLPYTASGLQSVFSAAKRRAGGELPRWHDLRGTAATEMVRAGVDPSVLEMIFGANIATLAAAYVNEDAVVDGVVTRLRQRPVTNRAVNRYDPGS